MVQLNRAYEKASSKDGLRILVERPWPRGLTKERQLDVVLRRHRDPRKHVVKRGGSVTACGFGVR